MTKAKRALITCGSVLLISACSITGAADPTPRAIARPSWQPRPGATWQIQFTGRLDLSVDADVFDIDMFDNNSRVVTALHRQGRRAVCYINGGAWEKWRPDATRFPASAIGRPLEEWPGERWLDITKLDILRPLMRSRLKTCAKKEFDGVDFDNVDGYTQDTGFPIRPKDQLAYNRLLAAEAHALGLTVGLKNDLGQIRQLEPDFDFAINESCIEYDECSLLSEFIESDKAVFHIEYKGNLAAICLETIPLRLSTIKKHRSLDAYREACPYVP